MDHVVHEVVDMSDLLLLAWVLLARQQSSKDEIQFAWSYGRSCRGILFQGRVIVRRSDFATDVLQQIQLLRRKVMEFEDLVEDGEDEEGTSNFMTISSSCAYEKSGSNVSRVC